MGEMKIDLIHGAKPMKKCPYKLSHKYSPIVQKDDKAMLATGIIYPICKSKWASPMVVQPKMHNPIKFIICVDFIGLNKLIVTDPFPTPFANEIINEVMGHKFYSFTNVFSGYNQMPITKEDGIKVDMAKIKVILDLKPPINHKQIKIFLGHTRYYRKFIQHYSNITFPIDELLKKEVEFHWSHECDKSFELLKRKLVEVPILIFPDWSRKFHVHVDASNVVVDSVLAQPYDDMVDHPNAYASRKLNKSERNYSTMEREALAMIFSLQKF
jgi:hypothetical protein